MNHDLRKIAPFEVSSNSAAVPQQTEPPLPAEAVAGAAEELSAPAVETETGPRPIRPAVNTEGVAEAMARCAKAGRGAEDEATSDQEPEVMTENDPKLTPGMEACAPAEEFSAKQLLALAALAGGDSKTRAAQAAGVNRGTIYRWLEEPRFAGELERMRRERADELRARIATLGDKALEALEDLVEHAYCERDRVAAVRLACRVSGLVPPA